MHCAKMIFNKLASYIGQVKEFLEMNPNLRTLFIVLSLALFSGMAILILTRTVVPEHGVAEFQALLSTPYPDDPAIQELLGELQNQDLSKPAQESVLEKLVMAERMASEQAAGARQAKQEKEPPDLPPSASLMNNAWNVPEGIYEGSQGLIRPSMADISNCWQGVRNGKIIQLFAGAYPDQSDVGILIVYEEHPEQMNRTMKIIPTQTRSGKLSIVSVREDEVTLKAADKTKLVFSLKTMEFIK